MCDHPNTAGQKQTSFQWFGAEEPEESPLDKLSAKDLLKELEDDRTADVEATEEQQWSFGYSWDFMPVMMPLILHEYYVCRI